MEGYNLMCMTKIVISNSENYTIHPDRNNFIRIYIYIYIYDKRSHGEARWSFVAVGIHAMPRGIMMVDGWRWGFWGVEKEGRWGQYAPLFSLGRLRLERLWKYMLIVLLLLIMFRAKLFKSHRIILAGYQEKTARARIWTVWQPQIHYFKQIYSNQWPRKGNRNPGREHKGSVHNKCNVHLPRELAAIIRAWAHFGSYY
jgi:hypothetical protein